jgi:uncharacterized membrane protein required for colicin V production
MGWILDISLLVLLALFVVWGFRSGVAKSLAEFGGTIVAVVAAVLLASALSGTIFEAFFKGPLTANVSEALQSGAGQDVAAKVSALLEALPGFIRNSLGNYGVTQQEIGQVVSGASGDAADAVVAVLRPIVTDLVRMVLMLVLFILLMIVVRLAARGIDKVFRIPVLHQLNSLLGGVFGILKCAVFVLLLCMLLRVALPMLNEPPELFSQETIDSTRLFRHIYHWNPIYSLFELL